MTTKNISNRPRVYISGPMTGLPNWNREAFNAMEDRLRSAGFEPLNPSANGVPDSAPRADHMRADLRLLINFADAVVCLPGWEKSPGVLLETAVANELNLPVYMTVEELTAEELWEAIP